MDGMPQAGTKLSTPGSGLEVIVIRPSSEPGLTVRSGAAAAKLGKRYACQQCGAEVLVIKEGVGELSCHGEQMESAQPKTLPSSD